MLHYENMDKKVEIIAEIGQNHNGDMELAKKMIWEAKGAGADVAKFQLYETRRLFTNSPDYPWFEYNCKTELKKEDLKMLKEECDRAEIEFMSSVFDMKRVDWLEELGVLRYKMASRSIKDRALMEKIYSTGKPVIVSLGMWNGKSFPETPDNSKTTFLYCISKYPTKIEDLKLGSVDFKKYGGFSDHTIGISAPLVAMAMGARIIEKHLTLDKNMYGPDHAGSATPEEFKMINIFRKHLIRML